MSLLGVLFLSSDELRELTDLKLASAQIRWLQKHGYPFEIGASGKPKVLRSYLLNRFQNFQDSKSCREPNFDAIRK